MKKKPIVIQVNWIYAAAFYAISLTASIITLTSHSSDSNRIVYIIFGAAGIAFSGFGIYSLFSRRFIYDPHSKQPGESLITITEEEITCSYPTKHTVEKVRWDNINKIEVLTTDEGPALCDVFIILHDSDGNCVSIPQDCKESKVVVDRILNYPEFNYKNFIKAMGSAENHVFKVWERDEERRSES